MLDFPSKVFINHVYSSILKYLLRSANGHVGLNTVLCGFRGILCISVDGGSLITHGLLDAVLVRPQWSGTHKAGKQSSHHAERSSQSGEPYPISDL